MRWERFGDAETVGTPRIGITAAMGGNEPKEGVVNICILLSCFTQFCAYPTSRE
jgi:hypothetical protein